MLQCPQPQAAMVMVPMSVTVCDKPRTAQSFVSRDDMMVGSTTGRMESEEC